MTRDPGSRGVWTHTGMANTGHEIWAQIRLLPEFKIKEYIMPNIKLSDEAKSRLYSKEVIGCQMTGSEVMLSLFAPYGKIQILDGNNQPDEQVGHVDIFLSIKQLEALNDNIKLFLAEQTGEVA